MNPPPPPPPPPPGPYKTVDQPQGTMSRASISVQTIKQVRRFESLLHPQACWPGRFIKVRRCGGLPMVLLQLKDPLELFVKSREFLPGSRSRCNMT